MAVSGVLFVHPRGFGFVNRSNGEDVFLPPTETFHPDAHDGAYVKVEITEHTPKGPAGRILTVHGPLPKKFEGIIREQDGRLAVEPDLKQLNGGAPPWAFVTNDSIDARPGDRVKAALRKSSSEVRCKVTNVMDRGVTGTIKRAAINAGMAKRSDAKMDEAPSFSDEGRADLTDRSTVVIDPEDAYDHDDAVSIRKTDDGWELGVHIADVAQYVLIGSELDKRARQNANTVYLPSRTYPMLPEELTQAASLDKGQNRAVSILISINSDGSTSIKDVVESKIEVDEQLTYKTAQQKLKNDNGSEALHQLKRAVDTLAEKRAKRAIIIEGGDLRPVIDEDGTVVKLRSRTMTDAHRLIEEAMIAANNHIARWLKRNEAPVLYRHHPPPESDSISKLKDHFSSIQSSGAPRKYFKSIIDTVKPGTLDYTFVVERLKRAMEKALYQTEPGQHFGLGLEQYAHFTSPVRRYADLLNHHSVKRTLRGEPTSEIHKQMSEVSDHLVQHEEKTIDLEREVRTICSIYYANQHSLGSLDGVVVDHHNGLSFVQLENGISGAYRGDLPLGTKNSFRIADTDITRREIDLIPASL